MAVGEDVQVAASDSPLARQTKTNAVIPAGNPFWQLLLGAGLGLAATLGFGKLAPRIAAAIHARFDPWELVPAAAAIHSARVRAEEEDLCEFLVGFRIGRSAEAATAALPGGTPAFGETQIQSRPGVAS